MDSGTAAVLCLTTVVSLLLLSRWLKSRTRGATAPLPPGPINLPVVGYLPFLSPDLHRSFTSLAQTHGPVLSLRLGSKLCVVLTSPSAARQALKDHDAIFANHDPISVAPLSDMLWQPYGPVWRTLRKISVRELLSGAGVEGFRPARRRETRLAVERLARSEGEAVEVRDVVFTATLGMTRSMLWSEAGAEGAAEFREVVEGVVELLGALNVSDLFPAVARWDLQGLGRRMDRMMERYDRLFDGVMAAKRRDGGGERRDFLEVLLGIVERGEGEAPLTMDNVKHLLLDMVTAGTDTTSTTVEWAMSQLLKNCDKMKLVQEEIDNVVGRNNIVEESDIPQLQYLEAVVMEVLRLHPAVPLLVPHCPRSSCIIDGYTIPKGSKVFINAWAIQRDPSLWENPSEFKPERFLNSTTKYDYYGSNFSYLPFGSGRRVCVGTSLGIKMVTYLLATLVHSFDWSLPEGVSLDLSEKFGIVLDKKEPLLAIPKLR